MRALIVFDGDIHVSDGDGFSLLTGKCVVRQQNVIVVFQNSELSVIPRKCGVVNAEGQS